MRRREFTLLVCSATALPLAARAQQTAKMRRIAVVHPSHPIADLRETGPSVFFRAFFSELRRLGYLENSNIIVERHTSNRALCRDRSRGGEERARADPGGHT